MTTERTSETRDRNRNRSIGFAVLAVAGLSLAGIIALSQRDHPSVDAVKSRTEDNARQGRLLHIYPDGSNSYLSFPADGVVKITGAFDPALTEIGRLCGAPRSIAFWRGDTGLAQIGYVTVGDDGCLNPFKAELAQLVQAQ